MGTPLLLGAGSFGVSYDADAQNYFNANTSITSAADKNAINTFYLGLKSDGIYSKIKAMYLPIWGTAANSKWNLVNPVDSNAAFRLTFATGMTFTSSGMTSNGTSGYANTFVNASTDVTLNNTHISFYSRTNQADSNFEMGATFLSGVQQYLTMYLRTSGNLFWSLCNVNQNNVIASQSANTDSRGFFIGNRTASNSLKGFINSTKVLDNTTPSGVAINYPIFISSINNAGSPLTYSTRQCAFTSIGVGLTDTEASNFYTRVQTLMTYFGINV